MTSMVSGTVTYSTSCYSEWEVLEAGIRDCSQDFKSKFSRVKTAAHRFAVSLRNEKVTPEYFMQRMAEKTAELAAIADLAKKDHARFLHSQSVLMGEEGIFDRVTITKEGALDAAKSAAESVVGGVVGGALGGMLAPPPKFGTPIGVIVGFAASLIHQMVTKESE